MSEFILHHYPASPFAEKIRLMLGFRQLPWRSVHIPMIMPKPDLTALTGGYRRTPVAQIGADIYCDTALIARLLERLQPSPSLYPQPQATNANLLALWADSSLFSAAVAYAFQPAGMQAMFGQLGPEQIAKFIEDRKEMRKGGSSPRMGLDQAWGALLNYLPWLESQLAGRDSSQPGFFCGSAATIADFAIYHPLWFIRRAGPLAALLDPYPRLTAWYARMSEFGHGPAEPLSSSDALVIARETAPDELPKVELRQVDGCALGDEVTVSATDYGTDPVRGELVMSSVDEIVIRRDDERAGVVQVHFPRLGYRIAKAG
ncbi:MAG: glutathione S-transferase family protein [Proteobacteria bacterium]|nr:glutathione S-transferase family protein [Pseudomonadota bacterium]